MNLTMPFDRKEYMKEYNKEYYKKNREKRKQQVKEYDKKNKEKLKEYRQTGKGKKLKRISQWRRSGVIHRDFDELYEKFINTELCELCSVKLTEDKTTTLTTRCLDHDHESGEFRNILCHSCNIRRG